MSALFHEIHRFYVEAECRQPLHVGSGEDPAEVLVKGSTGLPFVQGTSIAGAFSSYVAASHGRRAQEEYFGSSDAENGILGKSRLTFSEGRFAPGKLQVEMRTRVSLDGATGSVRQERNQGTDARSGQLMDMEYVSRGSVLTFSIYAFGGADGIVRECLSAMERGQILLGGKNSVGCGQMGLKRVAYRCYDLSEEEGRRAWRKASVGEEKAEGETEILEEIRKAPAPSVSYVLTAEMRLRTPFLVKANRVDEGLAMETLCLRDPGEIPDAMPLSDGQKDFILPGSSIKGVFRNRFEMIARYLGLDGAAGEAFGEGSGMLFEDAVILGAKEDGLSANQPRVHINKLSGSVMDKALFWEMTIGGRTSLRITVPKDRGGDAGTRPGMGAKAKLGLLLFILRDIHVGAATFGSGCGIGRGYMEIEKVRILDGEDVLAAFSMDRPESAGEFVASCMAAIPCGKGGGTCL